jgi:hypothetical protein
VRHVAAGLSLVDRGGAKVARGLLQAVIAFLVGAAGTEADTNKGRPRAAAEEQHREDNTEAEAERGLDEGVGQAAVPL